VGGSGLGVIWISEKKKMCCPLLLLFIPSWVLVGFSSSSPSPHQIWTNQHASTTSPPSDLRPQYTSALRWLHYSFFLV
jgi:hypothetical protein